MFRKREQLGVISEEERDPPPQKKRLMPFVTVTKPGSFGPTCSSQNAEMPGFAAKRRFIHKAAERGDGGQIQICLQESKGLSGIYGIKKQGGLGLWELGEK